MRCMSAKIDKEQLECVRAWAAQGVDLNGIQKKLREECGVHLTYMEVRFLLLDHGIEIAMESESALEADAPQPDMAPDVPSDVEDGANNGKVRVTVDDLQLPGTLISGKAEFPGGASGAWQIDQLGRDAGFSAGTHLDAQQGLEVNQSGLVRSSRARRGKAFCRHMTRGRCAGVR